MTSLLCDDDFTRISVLADVQRRIAALTRSVSASPSQISTGMELFHHGLDPWPRAAGQGEGYLGPVSVLRAETVKVLWSSWCDAVVAHQDSTGSWMVEYRGNGLTNTQSEWVASSPNMDHDTRFFGTVLAQGLLGCVIPLGHGRGIAHQVVLFTTDWEMESGMPPVQLYTVCAGYEIVDVKIASGGHVLVSSRNLATGEALLLHLEDLSEFRQCLRSDMVLEAAPSSLASFVPLQWCINAVTSTILDQHGKVHTSTHDPRYPNCLGRRYQGRPTFEMVPYLAETQVASIASGGYMTAAVSVDGELFLWGQGCPGTSDGLMVLNTTSTAEQDRHRPESRRTGIWAEGEQDELVKCLTVYIEGVEARVQAVAVGHGHVLVAAEASGRLAVLSAGDNSERQSNPESDESFLPTFTEWTAYKDEAIQELMAAGWSTLVLTMPAGRRFRSK